MTKKTSLLLLLFCLFLFVANLFTWHIEGFYFRGFGLLMMLTIFYLRYRKIPPKD